MLAVESGEAPDGRSRGEGGYITLTTSATRAYAYIFTSPSLTTSYDTCRHTLLNVLDPLCFHNLCQYPVVILPVVADKRVVTYSNLQLPVTG